MGHGYRTLLLELSNRELPSVYFLARDCRLPIKLVNSTNYNAKNTPVFSIV